MGLAQEEAVLTDTLPSPARRRWLGLLASLPMLGRAGTLSAAPLPSSPSPSSPSTGPLERVRFPDGAMILVAGPDGGVMDRWARAVQPVLAQSLAAGVVVQQIAVGGADGVTGANQFDVRVTPDGRTILLTPGEAVLAWLVGDPRAKFDVAHWVPVMACVTPAVVVGRPAAFANAGMVRVAASKPAGPDLPALLGIELLGERAELVAGIADEDALQAAFARGAVDAVLLHGHRVPDQARALAHLGVAPVFSFGMVDELGNAGRCSAFPSIPHFAEFYATRRGTLPSGPLFTAWRAAAAATQLEFGMVLSQVTPADMVALWRRAGADAAGALDVRSLAMSLEASPLSGPTATATATAVAADAPALVGLRDWLATRFNWRPT